ncbi:MAG: 1-deoxy-D-xylulose-5-phosphate reductoisomerase [Spirochaetia bacterium]|nr:1-deoxy-D-xylulose-5-phosphate reductoisomerase [Spirochaetia bacterium]
MQNEKVIIFGATGSIGKTAVNILKKFPELFSLTGFSYHQNFAHAKEIQKIFDTKYICCTNQNISREETDYWNSVNCKLTNDMKEILDIEHDTALISTSGSAGISVTYKAAGLGKKILLANKESLVMAGKTVMNECQKNQTSIVPVDSEHNSVFRMLEGKSDKIKAVDKLILTASGGPFFNKNKTEIQNASVEDVLRHPTWSMGSKITVDSAGMVNKALEIIEANHLFSMPYSRLDAVIHPQSYVHAIVKNIDGSYFFHVSNPDMTYPIAHGFFYPETPPNMGDERESLFPDFTFHSIEKEKFPAYFLGLEAGRKESAYPAVFNAANEEAVYSFLERNILFKQIPEIIEDTLNNSKFDDNDNSLEYILEADNWARNFSKNKIQKITEKR